MIRARPDALPHRRRARVGIDLEDLQGNLLRGYTHESGAYVFVRVADAARGRQWLHGLVREVTTAELWDEMPSSTLNLAFTYAGLAALGVSRSLLATFPEDFRDGMAARADLLGDRGENAPARWEAGLGTGEAHVLVSIYGVDDAALEAARARLQASLDAAGDAVVVVNEQHSKVLPGGHDHFGFKDGIAQPAIDDSGAEPRPGDGLPVPGRRLALAGAGRVRARRARPGRRLPDRSRAAVRPALDVRRLPQDADASGAAARRI